MLSQIAHDRGFLKDKPFPRPELCLLDNYQGLGIASLGLLRTNRAGPAGRGIPASFAWENPREMALACRGLDEQCGDTQQTEQQL